MLGPMQLVLQWLAAFALTVAIEVPIASVLLRGPRGRRVVLALVAQCASHPAVWFIFPELPVRYRVMLILAESWAVLSESAIYALLGDGVSWRRAFGVSLLANTASYLAWPLLR
jgi:hypothetical protein